MPLLNTIATPYAEALLQVAESRKETDTVAEQAKDLLAVLNSSPELQAALSSPVLEPDAKKAALATLFNDRVTPSVQNLLKLLADRQRLPMLDAVLIRFLELYRELRNITLLPVPVPDPPPLTTAHIPNEPDPPALLPSQRVNLCSKTRRRTIGSAVSN